MMFFYLAHEAGSWEIHQFEFEPVTPDIRLEYNNILTVFFQFWKICSSQQARDQLLPSRFVFSHNIVLFSKCEFFIGGSPAEIVFKVSELQFLNFAGRKWVW